MPTQYFHKGQWYNLEQFRKLRGINQPKEKEVISVEGELAKILEPELELKPKKKKK